MSNTETVNILYSNCISSLRNYVEEANNSCRLLEEIVNLPASMELWVKMLEQRQSENHAHELYQIARDHLFNAARPTWPN